MGVVEEWCAWYVVIKGKGEQLGEEQIDQVEKCSSSNTTTKQSTQSMILPANTFII